MRKGKYNNDRRYEDPDKIPRWKYKPGVDSIEMDKDPDRYDAYKSGELSYSTSNLESDTVEIGKGMCSVFLEVGNDFSNNQAIRIMNEEITCITAVDNGWQAIGYADPIDDRTVIESKKLGITIRFSGMIRITGDFISTLEKELPIHSYIKELIGLIDNPATEGDGNGKGQKN